MLGPVGSRGDATQAGLPRSPLEVVPPLRTRAGTAAAEDAEIAAMGGAELVAGIERLRRDRHAVVLAHNYQVAEIQDLADVVGDSLELARQAAAASADVIVVCGVHFMAETAALLNPGRRVLVPDPEAGCSLAASVTAEDVRRWRGAHPGAVAVAYVNTSAAVKAEVDVCCTSANAVEVVRSVPTGTEILFLPDRHLAAFVERHTGRRLEAWPGECHVHAAIGLDDVDAKAAEHPGAHLLLHPECGCVRDVLSRLADEARDGTPTFVLSTGGMARHARECEHDVELVATEVGMLHRLGKENRRTRFVPVRDDAVCSYMKTGTLATLYRALRDDVHEVQIPEPIAGRARATIERMLAVA